MAFRASELTVITSWKLFCPLFSQLHKMNNYKHVKHVNSLHNPMLFYSVYTCVIKESNLLVGQC